MRLTFIQFIFWTWLLLPMPLGAQVVEHEQHAFPEDIPAGGYSGITWLGEKITHADAQPLTNPVDCIYCELTTSLFGSLDC